MRFYILIFLVQVVAFYATADSDVTTAAIQEAMVVLKEKYPRSLKGRMESTPMQQYNLHAQCARLADLAGNSSSQGHLDAARTLRPKDVPESDIAYRYGYVDGVLSSGWAWRGGTYTIKQIAASVYKTDCPSPI